MITYIWTVLNMEVYSQLDDKSDVVYAVRWKCEAEEITESRVYSTNSNDIAFISTADLETFVDYQSLTQEQVLGWVYSVIDKQAVEANLAVQIEDMKEPAVQVLPLPWE